MVYSDYDQSGRYTVVECDSCHHSVDELYEVNGQQICLDCLLEQERDEFIAFIWDDIKEAYGKDYAQGYEVVEIDEG